MSEYTNESTGYIEGYAMRDKTVEDRHVAAFAVVKEIDRASAIEEVSPMYGRTVYRLNAQVIEKLTPLQRLTLAEGRPSPFGGVVRGNVVEVYND